MKHLLFALTILFGSTVFGQAIEIDTKKAKVDFNYVSEETKGTIAGIEAKVMLNGADLSNATVIGSAEVNSLSTANKMRDKHLKSADFFDAENYPKMKFTSASIVKTDKGYKATGTLTIKDVTKDVSFDVTLSEHNLIFTTTIYGADYGIMIKKKKGREASKVKIKVTVPLQ